MDRELISTSKFLSLGDFLHSRHALGGQPADGWTSQQVFLRQELDVIYL